MISNTWMIQGKKGLEFVWIGTACRAMLYFVLLPRLDWAYLSVVAVHVMVEQANDGGLSWGK